MSLISITKESDLYEYFKSISPADVRDCAEPRVYRKGKEYHEDDRVGCVIANSDASEIQAVVRGSAKYNVTIEKKSIRVYGRCTCGKTEICKHVVSVLLYGIHDRNYIVQHESEMQEQA